MSYNEHNQTASVGRASSLPSSHRGGRAESPSATQRMFFELAENKPLELPKHLQYKSPLRTRNTQAFAGSYSRYMEAKTPAPEPTPNLGRPDFERIHGSDSYQYCDTPSRVMDFLGREKEERQSNFVPLAPEEGVRYDPEVEAMKEYAANHGFAGQSRYEELTNAAGVFEDGQNPKEIAERRRKEKFGIHPRTFRPVSEISAKTFDEYANMAKVWKRTHGLEEEDDSNKKKMVRPSCVMEYVRHGTPILSRTGKSLTPTGQEKERVDEIRRRPHVRQGFVPTPFGTDFTRGPGSDRPKGFKQVKESYNREKEMIKNLAERLTGKSPAKYSPAHLIQLATPMSVQRALAEEKALQEAERQQREAEEEQARREEEERQRRLINGENNNNADGENNNNNETSAATGRDDVSYTTRKLEMNNNNSSARRGVSPGGAGGGVHRSRSPGVNRSRTPQGPQRPRHWR